MIRRTILLGTLAIAACGPVTPPPTIPVSAAPGERVIDPIVRAGNNATAFFRRPQPNQPAVAARAIADIEYLAGAVPADPRWQTASSSAQVQLIQARNQARQALGIPRTASAQDVIDGLTRAADALDANDRAAAAQALPRSIFTAGPDQTLRRLAQPPRIPSASAALAALSAGPSPRGP
ncbi:hypothetical protein [Roseomonas fluvialis]|uniref:Uncharacterized protein n=1 Tax=Roseomonas fluvialis TaxID=1750527 RepID=A0ABM7Y3R2_9PROT|nr:hypothetical protein [Roseomonas fluvialis]BDG72489.1 hypothetical protein Rmf_24180 [Roseomonas fluvialis]